MSTLAEMASALLADIHDVLGADMDIAMLLGEPLRAYDEPPASPEYPYLTYGTIRSEDRSGDDVPRGVHQITLHLYSRYSGRAETLDALTRVQSALEAGLPHAIIPLYADVFGAATGGQLTPHTRHGLLRLSIITEPNT